MTAAAKGPGSDDDGSLATQWFIVSDLGLTAFSGNDGIHVFVNSLATTAADRQGRGAAGRAQQRGAGDHARPTNAGHVLFEAGLARGEGGLSPAMLIVASDKADYAFLSLKSNGLRSVRPRRCRPARCRPALDAFVYAERGVYRSGETVYLTALLRDAPGNAVTGVPLTLVIERPDGVEYRRAVLPDQGRAAGRLTCRSIQRFRPAPGACAPSPIPSGPSVGETTFMVEDYVPDRLEFELTTQGQADPG